MTYFVASYRVYSLSLSIYIYIYIYITILILCLNHDIVYCT